jgi:hypothetical protein
MEEYYVFVHGAVTLETINYILKSLNPQRIVWFDLIEWNNGISLQKKKEKKKK